MIKARRLPWPNPADSPLDRARAIARDLHRALARHSPEEAARMAQAASVLGEPWLAPVLARHNDDDWLTLADAAEDIGGTANMVYKWTRREWEPLPTITDDRGRTLVRLGDVRKWHAEQREQRAERRAEPSS